MAEKVLWPFGKADSLTVSEADLANPVAISNNMTVLATATLTANKTLSLDISSQLNVGALLVVKVKTTATETLAFGTSIDAPTITGVAGKTKTQAFVYDGSIFVATGASVQID